MKNQLIPRNVTEATTLPRGKRPEIHPLTLEEIHQFLASTKDDRWFPAMLLAIMTGVRRGELLGSCWGDFDLNAATWHVRQALVRVKNHAAAHGDRKTRLICQPPKTAHSRRTIPLSANVIDALRRHKAMQAQEKLLYGEAYQDHGLVFCAPDGKLINPRLVTRQFQRLLQAAGVPHVRFHDLCHSFATMLLELGESPKTVQTLLGHSRINITLDIYSHVSLELETRAVANLTAALQAGR